MDDMEYLVQETMRLADLELEQATNPDSAKVKVPAGPGVLYHLQNSGPVFVVRTLVTEDLGRDYHLACEHPEDFPSLKLLENGGVATQRLRFFTTETTGQAEHIHKRVGQRRFPRREEDVCNLSDPGFSWWIENGSASFTLFGKMNWMREGLVRLGPLHDVNLAQPRWAELANLLVLLPLPLEVSTETSRFQLSAQAEHTWLVDEFRRIFTLGEVSPELRDLFVILGKRGAAPGLLESCWYFLQETAAVRRFWLKIQAELL